MARLPFAIVVYLVSLGIWASEGTAFPVGVSHVLTQQPLRLSASQPRPALHQAPSAKAGEVSVTSCRQAAGAPVHLFSSTSVITWQPVLAGSGAPVATGASSRPRLQPQVTQACARHLAHSAVSGLYPDLGAAQANVHGAGTQPAVVDAEPLLVGSCPSPLLWRDTGVVVVLDTRELTDKIFVLCGGSGFQESE